jgi:RNA polymerase sigma-70 factor (ECF subfamily)
MNEITLTELERLGAFDDAERTFQMTEEAFRSFYELTARPVWLYLARMTGDRRLADDLLQETYYRFLRVSTTFESDDHRRH